MRQPRDGEMKLVETRDAMSAAPKPRAREKTGHVATKLAVSASALMLAIVAGSSPAAAQDTKPSTSSALPDPRPWEVSLTPYVWATALKGDAGVGRVDADVDTSFSDILDNLNGAVMLSAKVRKGRFGLLSDTVFANLGDDGATSEDRLKIDVTANMLI